MYFIFITFFNLFFILDTLSLRFTNTSKIDGREVEVNENTTSSSNIKLERKKRGIYKQMLYRWTFPIQYSIEDSLNSSVIDEAIHFLERETCVRFEKVEKVEGKGIKYISGEGCFSVVGMISEKEPQNITIEEECQRVGIVEHETSHALGLLHEHTREDREDYIDVKYENIDNSFLLDFQIFNNTLSETFNLTYDYGSVLHYNKYAGSMNEGNSLNSKDIVYSKTMGQREQLSFNDIKLLNLYYCNSICKEDLKCLQKGYPDPNNCSVCKCPRHFTGNLCEKLKESDTSCGDQLIEASLDSKTLNVSGVKSCYYKIYAEKGYNILLIIREVLTESYDICEPSKSIEISFLENKAISGAMFCGYTRNILITTEGTEAIIHYIGSRERDFIELEYKKVRILEKVPTEEE